MEINRKQLEELLGKLSEDGNGIVSAKWAVEQAKEVGLGAETMQNMLKGKDIEHPTPGSVSSTGVLTHSVPPVSSREMGPSHFPLETPLLPQ